MHLAKIHFNPCSFTALRIANNFLFAKVATVMLKTKKSLLQVEKISYLVFIQTHRKIQPSNTNHLLKTTQSVTQHSE